MRLFLCLIFLLTPSLAFGDAIADLLKLLDEQDVQDTLKDMERRFSINNPDLKPIPMRSQVKQSCPDGSGEIVFMPKPGNEVFWGLSASQPAGIANYKGKGAGAKVEQISNPVFYPYCQINEEFLREVTKFACSQKVVKVFVHSAIRTPKKNSSVGGASKSQHLRCRAMDFSFFRKSEKTYFIERMDHKLVQQNSRKNSRFTGLGLGEDFTHLDNRELPIRPPRDEWTYPRSK